MRGPYLLPGCQGKAGMEMRRQSKVQAGKLAFLRHAPIINGLLVISFGFRWLLLTECGSV